MTDLAKRERTIFEAALELSSAAERRAYVSGVCANDAELRERVEALLRAHEEAGGFLPEDDPNPGAARTSSTLLPVTEKPGDRIGRYKLREKVGEGGCGVVYVAEQEEPVRRRVALKVIKLGMDTRSVIARFEAERQALAIMDHPNVAKVLDAGATETGRPYFVMELVRGIRITEYCDQNNLSTTERLDLFIKVCQAVQHAHQKGIIHRDIKPSNILVTLHDGVPVPKIIDFGIAKATEGRLTDLTVYTELNQFIGTPAYMSPEQAEMSGLDIDTRSDIYSLGVLLYELLTGQPPFDPRELLRQGLDEIRRTIREVEPPRPSTRLSTLAAASLSDVAQHRHTEAPKLLSLIRGDLDWIVMKCLEKDRTRRYETATGLAADIQRHLQEEPVVARPPSAAYRFQKLVRRNKVAVAVAGAIAAALIVGLAVSLAALSRERAANARAEEQRRLAEQRLMAAVYRVESVLTNDVRKVWGLPGSTPVVEGMLRDTVAFMEALAPARSDHPEFLLASAKIHARLAWSQANKWGASLGNPDAALASASNAWKLLQAIPLNAVPAPRLREATFWAEEASGMALEAMGRVEEAPEHYRRMLQVAEELDAELPRSGKSRWSSEARLRILGFHFLKNQFALAREENAHLLRDPFLLTNAASTDLDRLAFTELALGIEGVCYMSVSNWVSALDYLRKALAFCDAYLAQSYHQHIEYHAAQHVWKIGVTLCAQGNYVEGIRTFDEACRRQEALVNGDKEAWLFQHLLTDMRLGGARQRIAASKQGGLPLDDRVRLLEEARQLLGKLREELRALGRKVHSPEDVDTLQAINDLAISYFDVGDREEALKLREELLALRRKVLGPEHIETIYAMDWLAISYFDAGRREEALKLREEVVALCRRILGPEHRDTLRTMHNLALSYTAATRRQDALKLREELLALRRKVNGPEHLDTVRAMIDLAELHWRRGDFAAAEPLYREVLQIRRARLDPEHQEVIGASSSLARVLAEWAWAERTNSVAGDVRRLASESPKAQGLVTAAATAPLERAREAERLLRDTLAIRLRGTNATHWRTHDVRSRLGFALVALAEIDSTLSADAREAKLIEAETLLRDSNQELQRRTSVERKYKRDAVERLMRLNEAWGKPDKVPEWRQKLETLDKTANEPSSSEEQTQ